MEKPHTFLTLDALRGVAAIAVMALHYQLGLGGNPVPQGFLAVDFFFMLSGFVLVYAYQPKLDAGWSTYSFLKARVARLYPLYLLGLVLGLIFRVGFLHGAYSRRDTAVSFVLGLLILPGIHLAQGLFPLNSPAWSLFFEYMANLLHAAFMRRRSLTFLCSTLAASALVLIFMVVHNGTIDTGVKSSEYFSLPRILFPYLLGMLLFRIWKTGRIRIPNLSLLACALLLAPMVVRKLPQDHAAFDLGVTMILFPVILLIGAASQPPRIFTRAFQLLGEISYPVYVLHVPVFRIYWAIWERVCGRAPDHYAPWATLICMLFTIVLSLLLGRTYDLWGRSVLRRWLLERPKTSTAVTTNA